MNICFKTREEKIYVKPRTKVSEIFSIYVNGRITCALQSLKQILQFVLLIASLCSKLDNIVVSVCLVVKLRSYDTERTIFGSTFLDIA